MKMNKTYIWLISSFLLVNLYPVQAQNKTWPSPPQIRSYQGKQGRVTKYNNFNYLEFRDDSLAKNRQVLGRYWEISYAYDSIFRQKLKFKNFMINQVMERNGKIFFQDTTSVQFVIPEENGNIWVKMVLATDKIYRLRVIKETPFSNRIVFDKPSVAVFDKYVDSIQLPPRINYLPGTIITRSEYSKFNHQTYTWSDKDTLFKQKVMGPFWDLKLEVQDKAGEVDRTVSAIEVMESYYRATMKAGGKIIKSRPKELIFTLLQKGSTIWCRVTTSLDGVYFVRLVIESDSDRSAPEKTVNTKEPVEEKSGER